MLGILKSFMSGFIYILLHLCQRTTFRALAEVRLDVRDF